MKALAVTADGFEDSELLDPLQRLRAPGSAVRPKPAARSGPPNRQRLAGAGSCAMYAATARRSSAE